jgi:branched-chain amino acid transport system permease protein
MQFYESILIFTLINVIAVSGIHVITGLTGMISLGQASFMALGAYISGMLVLRGGLPFTLAAIIAVIATILVGLVIALPTVRLRRDYTALVTLGFGEAITSLLNQSVSLTGGALGLSNIPKKTTLFLCFISTIVCIFLVVNFKLSKFGRQAIAIRSDELAAKSMGINVSKIKLISFLFSVALTSYAGILYAFYTTYIDPSMFGWRRSGEWVITVFFGGINSLTGSIVATFVLNILPEILRFAYEWRIVVYATLVLIIINFKPEGLFGEREITNLFRKEKQLR